MLQTILAGILGAGIQGYTAIKGAKTINDAMDKEQETYNSMLRSVQNEIDNPYLEDSAIRGFRTAFRDSSIDAYNRMISSKTPLGLTEESANLIQQNNALSGANMSAQIGMQESAVNRQLVNQLNGIKANHNNYVNQMASTKANMLANAGKTMGNVMGNVAKADTNTIDQDLEAWRKVKERMGW